LRRNPPHPASWMHDQQMDRQLPPWVTSSQAAALTRGVAGYWPVGWRSQLWVRCSRARAPSPKTGSRRCSRQPASLEVCPAHGRVLVLHHLQRQSVWATPIACIKWPLATSSYHSLTAVELCRGCSSTTSWEVNAAQFVQLAAGKCMMTPACRGRGSRRGHVGRCLHPSLGRLQGAGRQLEGADGRWTVLQGDP
jgi:hypothetical protein